MFRELHSMTSAFSLFFFCLVAIVKGLNRGTHAFWVWIRIFANAIGRDDIYFVNKDIFLLCTCMLKKICEIFESLDAWCIE